MDRLIVGGALPLRSGRTLELLENQFLSYNFCRPLPASSSFAARPLFGGVAGGLGVAHPPATVSASAATATGRATAAELEVLGSLLGARLSAAAPRRRARRCGRPPRPARRRRAAVAKPLAGSRCERGCRSQRPRPPPRLECDGADARGEAAEPWRWRGGGRGAAAIGRAGGRHPGGRQTSAVCRLMKPSVLASRPAPGSASLAHDDIERIIGEVRAIGSHAEPPTRRELRSPLRAFAKTPRGEGATAFESTMAEFAEVGSRSAPDALHVATGEAGGRRH